MKTLDKRGSYVLLSLGFLFAIGAAVRFLPSSFAIASETLPGDHSETEDIDPADASAAAVKVEPINQVCFSEETAATLAADQKTMEAQFEELTEQELSLQARQQELDRRAVDLDALQQTLAARWKEMQAASDEDLIHLARMYGTMKPDQAAAIFNQMDPDFAGSFLRLMRSEQAGLILASMETRKAYEVSLKLAEMNEDIRQTDASN
ncbi:MotE family protein [Hyphomonas sp.]|jgi:flagellar motility protein MotE (MotC chaperone)|uniref:MotE family protein n=1 Tax=Hyphomonas sp. TaxID=87 RepID=UPI0035678C19